MIPRHEFEDDLLYNCMIDAIQINRIFFRYSVVQNVYNKWCKRNRIKVLIILRKLGETS